MSFLTSTNPAFPVRLEGGARLGWSDDQSLGVKARSSVRLSSQLIQLKRKGGDLSVLPFEVILIPNSEQFRIRFKLAETDVTFICGRKDGQGGVAPFVSLFSEGMCRPDALFGVSAQVMEFQMDTFSTHRIAMRLAEVRGVINLLGNGMATNFLKRQLLLSGGGSWDAIIPNRADANLAGHVARMVLGVQGVWISDESNWEVRGVANLRPSLTDGSDWASEVRGQIIHRFELGENFLGEVGGTAQYSFWSIPGRSLGTYASDRDQHTLFLGALLGLHYNPK